MHRGRKVRKGDFSLDRVCGGVGGGVWGSGATVLWGRNGIPNALQDGIKMYREKKVRKGDFRQGVYVGVCGWGCVGEWGNSFVRKKWDTTRSVRWNQDAQRKEGKKGGL